MSRTKETFEPRISLITLGVRDVEASAQFYERMGFERSKSSSTDSVVFIPLRGIVLGLFSRTALAEDAGLDASPPTPFGGITIAYNTRSEEEVDRLFELMVSVGGKPLKAPQKVFWGGYSCYVADPDGHPWEIAFNPHWEVSPDGAMRLPAG
ncbi:VOC family protein [Agaricicola taiwanensis]|nr:VOC family protein [Agaricicola taiwanensis]